MILGIGVDLLNLSRVEELYSNFRDKFVNRILSEEELKEYKNSKKQINFISKRFCSKEAFSKAIGTGIGRGINFKDIIISNDILGKPTITLSNKGFEFLEKHFKRDIKNIQFDLSITDEDSYITSFVVISI